MKHEIDVTAYRMLTEYDRNNSLLSTIELRLPPEELEYMQEVLDALDADKDVRSTLIVRNKEDGEPRRLPLTLKSSKMKNFVPVAVFTKYGHSHDNLTELFSTGFYGRYELLLIVEVVEPKEEADPLDFEREPVTPTWVLQELLMDEVAEGRYLDEGCPHCPEARDPAYVGALRHLGLCNAQELCELLEHVGIDPTRWDDPKRTSDEVMTEQRAVLASHWQELNLTVVMQGGEA